MSYVIGYSVLAGALAWFCLVCDARAKRDGQEEENTEVPGAGP
ncbi:hypothetical protein PBI_MISSWHITE_61 [Mycobacterium phage MissWhite]|nr:hypothetical protein PBI_MISSWHITE_61 [Mycobacterium phage MissWhite]